MVEKDSVDNAYSKQRQMLKSLLELCRSLNKEIVPLDSFVEALFSEEKNIEKTLSRHGYSDSDVQKIQQFLIDAYRQLESSNKTSEAACV